jgi:hypothetical protein
LATAILSPNKLRGIRQIYALPLFTQREKAQHKRPGTVCAPAATRTALIAEGVEAIVDRYFVALPNRLPGKHMGAFAHRIGITGVIKVAAWRQQNGACIPIKLAQMPPVFL